MKAIKTNKISHSLTACNSCFFLAFCYNDELEVHANHMLTRVVSQQQDISKRHTLCLPQQIFRSLYVVKAGGLKASFAEIEGKERIKAFYLPGEVVGLEAIYTRQYTFAIQALSDTQVCEIPFPNLLNLISTKPEWHIRLLQLTSRQLTMGGYISLIRAEQRLAGFLLELAGRLNANKLEIMFTLPMSRQAIADYLGLAPETIIRMIHQFAAEGMIVARNKQIQLRDLAKLSWLIQGGTLEKYSAR